MPGLNPSSLVSVQVQLSPQGASSENFGALLMVGGSNVIDVNQRYRQYSSLAAVAADFGTAAPEYIASNAYFAQSPQPQLAFISRWAKTGTPAILYGTSLTLSQQALSSFTSITTGALTITVDGTVKNNTGISFAGVTSMNGIATVLNALPSMLTVWDAINSRFVVTTSDTGAGVGISFATTAPTGIDLKALLGLNAGTIVLGIGAESLLTAVTTVSGMTNDFYGVAIADPAPADADVIAVASFLEAASPRKFFVATTQDANALLATSTTDLAAVLSAGDYTHTACQYSSSSPYAACSLFGKICTTDYTANNSTINLMYQTEPSITFEILTDTQAAVLKSKNCNVFVRYSNDTSLIQWGQTTSGNWMDAIIGSDWYSSALQTELFDVMLTSKTKVSQTDTGVNRLVTAATVVSNQAVTNGLVGRGLTWTGPNVGAIVTGQVLSAGFYIFAPPVISQTQADRSARKSPTLQICACFAGAIDTVSAIINVIQ